MRLSEQVAYVEGHSFLLNDQILEIKWIRGNIDTRLEKLENEDYDAIILAAAGLIKNGLDIGYRDRVS